MSDRRTDPFFEFNKIIGKDKQFLKIIQEFYFMFDIIEHYRCKVYQVRYHRKFYEKVQKMMRKFPEVKILWRLFNERLSQKKQENTRPEVEALYLRAYDPSLIGK